MDIGEQICWALSDKTLFVFSPIWSHVNEKKWQKSKLWDFANLYTKTLVETPPPLEICMIFLWMNLTCTFRGDVVWSYFLPYGFMLTKTKKKILKKIKMQNGLEIQWKGTFPLNLALICLMGSEKMGFMDGRTTDARVTTVALLCSSVKQS